MAGTTNRRNTSRDQYCDHAREYKDRTATTRTEQDPSPRLDDDDNDNDDHDFELRNTLLMWSRMNPCFTLCIIFDEENRLAAAAAAVSTLPFLSAS